MNVLISGNLSGLTTTLVNSFSKERFRVVLASSHADVLKIHLPNVRVHTVSPATDHFQQIVSSYKFDVVIYLATREEHLLYRGRQNTGEILDGLLNILELCKKERIQRLFFISSTEIYGNQEMLMESEDPLPTSPNGFTLRTGEQYCSYYSEHHNLAPTIVRVPFLYGQDEKETFLHEIIQKCIDGKKVTFPGNPETTCSFLNTEDVADFILKALDLPLNGRLLVNLPSADLFTFEQLGELLRIHFPEAKFEYNPSKRILTRPAAGLNAKRYYDSIAEHRLANELPSRIEEVRGEAKPKEYLLDKIQSRFPRYQTFLKWTEVILGAVVMHYLSILSGSVFEFRFIDFRLAYVILLAAIYGTQVGLIASILAGLSVLISWRTLGFNWTELIYNVSNWLPFTLYLAVGVITGYVHDKRENEIHFQQEQTEQIKEKYTFLYELFQEVSNLKNQFYKQLVGSRDSFGRIFKITRELDTLDEEEVIFNALHILEDILENNSIAIYSIHEARGYVRLEISSSNLQGQITKSLNLRDYPDIISSIEKGEIFKNTLMKPDLPAYFAPIRNDSAVTAGVAVWDASYEQHSSYYANLLKVICGLIESSINRVSLFRSTNVDKYYLPNTKILSAEYFEKVLKIKIKMKKNKIGSYLLVKVGTENDGRVPHRFEDMYPMIASMIREEDYVGILDGSYYILLSQADPSNAGVILDRLTHRGISCQMVSDPNVLPLEASEVVTVTKAAINQQAN